MPHWRVALGERTPMPDPKEYLDRYTYLRFTHPLTGVPTDAGISGYGSGWGVGDNPNRPSGGDMQHEYLTGFRPALRKYLTGSANKKVDSPFFFNTPPVANIDPAEPFYNMSFIRAFLGKGSPDEIIDTLRIAIVLGRIGHGTDANNKRAAFPSAAQYSTKFMTLDCNGLTGNFYGINPETSVQGYAVPGRRRQRADDVQVGDVVVTVTAGGGYQHVALVAYWDCPPASGATGRVNMKLCEWGQAGDESNHYTGATPREVNIRRGPNTRYGVGFEGRSGSFRYIFAGPASAGSRGWGLGEDMAR